LRFIAKAMNYMGRKLLQTSQKMSRKSYGGYSYGDWEVGKNVYYFRDKEDFMDAMEAVSWVFSCVRVIYQTASKVELYTYRGDQIVEDGDLYNLIQKPNPFFTTSDLIASYCIDMSLVGEHYLVKQRMNGFGQPTELWRVDPRYMKPIPDRQNFIAGFVYEYDGNEVFFDVDEVIWLRYPHPKDPYGALGPVQALVHGLEIETARQDYDKHFFKNYGMIGGYLHTDEVLPDDHFQRLKEEVKENMEGAVNSGRIPVFDAGLEYKSIGLSRKEMNLLEDAKFNRERILSAFGVPPAKVGVFEYANYANSKEQDEMFKRETIAPLLKKLVDALNHHLVPAFSDEMWIGHEELVPEDADKIAERVVKLSNANAFTINEIREAAGKPPVPNGDIILVNSGLVPLDMAGAQFAIAAENNNNNNEQDSENNNVNDNINNNSSDNENDNVNEDEPEENDKGIAVFDSKTFKVKKLPKNPRTIHRRKMRYLAAIEKQWKPEIKKFFEAQGDRVIRAIYGRGKKSGHYNFDIEDIFDQAFEDEELQKLLSPLHIQVIKRAWKEGDDLTDQEIPIDLETDPALKNLLLELAALVKRINDTTRNEIAKQVRIAMERGYSIPQLANGYAKEGFKGIRGVFEEASESRARTIARTETANVYNQGSVIRFQRAGIKYVYVLDGVDFDEECRAANGQIWTLEKAMENPTEHPNCTRAFAPAVEYRED
jgi:HK97 family phage portal protein